MGRDWAETDLRLSWDWSMNFKAEIRKIDPVSVLFPPFFSVLKGVNFQDIQLNWFQCLVISALWSKYSFTPQLKMRSCFETWEITREGQEHTGRYGKKAKGENKGAKNCRLSHAACEVCNYARLNDLDAAKNCDMTTPKQERGILVLFF